MFIFTCYSRFCRYNNFCLFEILVKCKIMKVPEMTDELYNGQIPNLSFLPSLLLVFYMNFFFLFLTSFHSTILDNLKWDFLKTNGSPECKLVLRYRRDVWPRSPGAKLLSTSNDIVFSSSSIEVTAEIVRSAGDLNTPLVSLFLVAKTSKPSPR